MSGGSSQAVTWVTGDRWWLSWPAAWPGAPSALHTGWWNIAHSQGNPRLVAKGVAEAQHCCSSQGWAGSAVRGAAAGKYGWSQFVHFPFEPGRDYPFCTALPGSSGVLCWWALFLISYFAKEPLGKSTWYFSWVRHLFDQNSALSRNALPQLVLGIERLMWRNQINFLSSTRLSIKVWEGKSYNFSLFFLIPWG